jgi:hypothetical protein
MERWSAGLATSQPITESGELHLPALRASLLALALT